MISAGLTNKTRKEVYRRDGYMCALCGDPRRLQIHHYRHRSQGGNDDPMNLITLCSYCHAVIHKQWKPEVDYMTAEELDQACAEYLADYYNGEEPGKWDVWLD